MNRIVCHDVTVYTGSGIQVMATDCVDQAVELGTFEKELVSIQVQTIT